MISAPDNEDDSEPADGVVLTCPLCSIWLVGNGFMVYGED